MLRKAKETKLRLIQESNKRLMEEDIMGRRERFKEIKTEIGSLSKVIQIIEKGERLKYHNAAVLQGNKMKNILRKVKEAKSALEMLLKAYPEIKPGDAAFNLKDDPLFNPRD